MGSSAELFELRFAQLGQLSERERGDHSIRAASDQKRGLDENFACAWLSVGVEQLQRAARASAPSQFEHERVQRARKGVVERSVAAERDWSAEYAGQGIRRQLWLDRK